MRKRWRILLPSWRVTESESFFRVLLHGSSVYQVFTLASVYISVGPWMFILCYFVFLLRLSQLGHWHVSRLVPVPFSMLHVCGACLASWLSAVEQWPGSSHMFPQYASNCKFCHRNTVHPACIVKYDSLLSYIINRNPVHTGAGELNVS